MRNRIITAWAAFFAAASTLSAATYYVSKTGGDGNNGSQNAPWLTVQKAANTAVAGDTVNIAAGTYNEYVQLSRSGTAQSPIIFNGPGTMGGVKFQANYIVLTNLTIDAGVAKDYLINMSGTPSYNKLVNCTIHTRGASWVFSVDGNYNLFQDLTINGDNDPAPGPPAQIFAITGAYNVVNRCYIFNGVDVDFCKIFGHDNLISSNELVNLSNPNAANAEHSDFIQTFGDNGETSYNQVIEANFVHDCSMQICNMSTDVGNVHDFAFRNNVFANVAYPAFNGVQRTLWYDNVFYKCGVEHGYPIAIYGVTAYNPAGSEIVNNVFLECGTAGNLNNGAPIGNGYSLSALRMEHNYFAKNGTAGLTGQYLGTSAVNGGDAKCVNPAGENFHIQAGSILIGAATNLYASFTKDKDGNARPATGAWDIGAYEYGAGGASTNPAIAISPNGTVSFGSIAVNTTATQAFTVRNVGGGVLSGTASVAAPFSVVSGASYNLGSNQSQTVTVRYSPVAAQSDSQVLTFTGGGGASATLSGSAWAVLPGLAFASTAGTITAPFMASGGYVSQTVQTGVSGAGSAIYGFSVPAAGKYTVSANVIAPTDSANSFYVNIDAEPTDPTMIWDMAVSAVASNQTVTWRGSGTDAAPQYVPQVFNLSAGTHELIILGREAGAQLGSITIAPYSTNSQPTLPPTVSAITQNGADIDPNADGLQVYAGSVVQYSGSATDPNDLPLSWQWLYSVNGGGDTLVLSGTGTVASVTYNYTASTAGNTYTWKLRVSNGYASSESDLAVGVEALPPVAGNGVIQAASGTITSPFTLDANGNLSQAVQTIDATSGGRAAYTFTVTNAGSYVIQALVNAPNDSANSFYLNIDAEPQDPTMIWDIPLTSGFEQRVVSWRGNGTDVSGQFVPKVFTLAAGQHQVIIRGREANVQLGSFAFVQLPTAPQNLRVVVGY